MCLTFSRNLSSIYRGCSITYDEEQNLFRSDCPSEGLFVGESIPKPTFSDGLHRPFSPTFSVYIKKEPERRLQQGKRLSWQRAIKQAVSLIN
ncbi:unnamed protein product, partial [Mesorhabditis belari]|uniref:Uncharacterized protein n=1 Tax=Mesorhabditis belari TaxID=2138241 RepID=A0AAF3EBP1_9BILA